MTMFMSERMISMKKCPDCEREVDRIGLVCEFCGKVVPKADVKSRSFSGEEESS